MSVFFKLHLIPQQNDDKYEHLQYFNFFNFKFLMNGTGVYVVWGKATGHWAWQFNCI